MQTLSKWLNRTCLLPLALVAHSVAPADGADIVTRKGTATRVSGNATSVSKTEITIKPTAGEAVTIPVSEISSVEWDDMPGTLRVAIGYENAGQLQKAIDAYGRLKSDNKLPSDNLKNEVDYLIARASARLALADPTLRTEIAKKVEGLLKSTPDYYRHYDLLNSLGQLYMADSLFDDARRTFERLSNSSVADTKLQGQVALARVALAENKLDEASTAYDAVIANPATSAGEKLRRYDAMLGKARVLVAQSRVADALPLLETVLAEAPVEESSLQAETYLLQGNCLQALNRAKDAVLAYLHVDVLYARESNFHSESLYHLAKLWKVVQNPDRAIEAQARLEADYPNSEWAKKLAGGT